MKGLSRESRGLIDAARDGDEPSAADRKRVRSGLARKIALGAAAGAVAATATHAAAGGVAAAGTGGAAAGGAAAGSAIGAGASVGAGVAGGAAAGGASVAAGAIAASFGAKLLVSVAIMGAVSAGTVGYVRHEAAKRASVAARVATVERLAPASPSVRKSLSPSSAPPIAFPTVALAPVAPTPAAPVARADAPPAPGIATPAAAIAMKPLVPTSPPPSAVAPPSSDLDVELALLQEAHGALRMNDGSRALRLLDEHARRFPNGALAEESEAARVFALCQVGRAAEARDVAGRFLREHPRSPLAPRVSRACDAGPSTF